MSFRILLAKSDCWWALESAYVGQFLKKSWETLQNIELQVGLENVQILMWIRKTLSNMLLSKKGFRSGLMCLSSDIIAGGDYQYFRSLSKKWRKKKKKKEGKMKNIGRKCNMNKLFWIQNVENPHICFAFHIIDLPWGFSF